MGLGYDVERDRSSARIVSGQYTKHTGYLTGHTDSVPGSRGRVDGRDDRALGHGDFRAEGVRKGVKRYAYGGAERTLHPLPGAKMA